MITMPTLWRQKILLVTAVAAPLRKMAAEIMGFQGRCGCGGCGGKFGEWQKTRTLANSSWDDD
jgi:hypothetical protein